LTTFALVLAVLFFIAGFVFTVFPVLPGILIIFAGMLVYGLLAGFETLGLLFFVGQAVAVGLSYLADYAAGVWAVKKYGGSSAAVWGSIIGVLAGIFVFGPFGIILGPFLGAVAGEILAGGAPSRALRAGIGTLVGFLGATGIKLVIGAGMVVWFFSRV